MIIILKLYYNSELHVRTRVGARVCALVCVGVRACARARIYACMIMGTFVSSYSLYEDSDNRERHISCMMVSSYKIV